ncbi:unnamed protein product [Phytomonas sp. EM1]|nr:unnamed protein product [Phytomonas sp. EM1]|eukprot:CCW63077.1 unnamed protein product [Phytomonas sp. isolate EM1]
MSNTLVINLSFNCPVVDIIGPIKETTIERLNELLPTSTTSTRNCRSEAPKFQYLSNPDHWHLKLDGQLCDSEGVSHFIVVLLDVLEQEGGWTLVSSQASNSDNAGAIQQKYVENYKLFFSKFVSSE